MVEKKKILFIGGSLNQTTMAHQVARQLQKDFECFFTPYFCDYPCFTYLNRKGWFNFTVLGGTFRQQTEKYLSEQGLPVDYGGRAHDYDLVVTTSDLLIQNSIRNKKIVLIQEGITDPENLFFPLVKWFKLPRWLTGNTSATGLSGTYQCFCVASQGYRDLFVRKGVDPEKIVVTGIPNFDNAVQFLDNTFPFRDYVLAATSDIRETKRFDNRAKFIKEVLDIAGERPVIFKLHPNEKAARASKEIRSQAPEAIILQEGDPGPMVANCSELVTQFSSLVYIGLALGKKVHSYFNLEKLKRLLPLQNGGTSGEKIAGVCRQLL